MKKFLLLILSFLFLFICSCDSENIKLPSLEGKSRAEITKIMKKYDIDYGFSFAPKIITSNDMLDKFVAYTNGYESGSLFPRSKFLTIYTTVLPVNPHRYKELTMNFDWAGKSFLKDGYGEVTLSSNVDGDTAWFIDKVTNERFKLRFLGINTPETHAGEDPWGEVAAAYTAMRLNNAKSIVLESEGSIKDTYDRYLGFVWVDGELLNLELIELAYAEVNLSNSKYEEIFLEASIEALKTGRGCHGEIDPNYDYETKKFK